MIKKIILFLMMINSFFSCKKELKTYPELCLDGNCDANYKVFYLGDTLQTNNNGHYELEYAGLNYFQVIGDISSVHEDYTINGVPQVSANFDSDYWILFDTLKFTIPMYSYLGWFNEQTMNTPIPIGSYSYTMIDLIDLHPPLNAVGYQIPTNFCWDCPYSSTIVGVNSRYNYRPTCNVLLDNEMVGDTINIFIETVFNTEGGIQNNEYDTPSPKLIIENRLKVIFI